MSRPGRPHSGLRAQEESRCGTLEFIAVQRRVQKHVVFSSSTFTRGIPIRRIESPMQWSRKARHERWPYRTPSSFGEKPKGSARIRDRQPASSNNKLREDASSSRRAQCPPLYAILPLFPSTRRYVCALHCFQARGSGIHFNSRETRESRLSDLEATEIRIGAIDDAATMFVCIYFRRFFFRFEIAYTIFTKIGAKILHRVFDFKIILQIGRFYIIIYNQFKTDEISFIIYLYVKRTHAVHMPKFYIYRHSTPFSKISGRRTADSTVDRKHMFLARSSRFAGVCESNSCRVLVIKSGLNVNLHDADVGDDDDGSLPERVR